MLDALSPLLALAAGALSILSPCVFPLLPIVFGGARSAHPLGPLALGAGLAASFTIMGLFVATVGFSIGLDGELLRGVGGWLMLAFGLVLLVPALQDRFAAAAGPIGDWAHRRVPAGGRAGLAGQGALGALLGLVWVPCVGPTLGAASMLAAQGENLGQVSVVMIAFGLGAAIPLTGIGYASARALSYDRGRAGLVGRTGKQLLGGALALFGALVVTGADRSLEIALTDLSPDWLVELTTRY